MRSKHLAGTVSAVVSAAAAAFLAMASAGPAAAVSSVPGMDVSAYQGSVNWSGAHANGARFAYVKATEGTSYTNPDFASQYNGSYNAGFIRGAYHFARPNVSSGSTQASYFIAHGGGWSSDGKTLPGALDLEANPYSGGSCYGLSTSSMQSWITSFNSTYHSREGVYPVIYTSTSFWSSCVGSLKLSATNPLWVARYSSSVGALPYGWSYYTFWQYADSGTFPGDQDTFNGSTTQLQKLAKG